MGCSLIGDTVFRGRTGHNRERLVPEDGLSSGFTFISNKESDCWVRRQSGVDDESASGLASFVAEQSLSLLPFPGASDKVLLQKASLLRAFNAYFNAVLMYAELEDIGHLRPLMKSQ